MDFADLRIERRGSIARVVIDRPDRLNALRMTVTDRSLVDALSALEADRDIKLVILTGAGERAFSTGWDMEEIGNISLLELEALIRSNLEMFFKVWYLRQPVIAAINGYALGAGSALALACDLALAADNAKLGEPEVRHGALSPFPIMTFFTHGKIAHELYYLGDMVDAGTMKEIGLVNRVVAAADLEDFSWRFAERMCNVPAESLEMTKRSLRATYDIAGLAAAVRQHALADTLVIGGDFPDQNRLLQILEEKGMRAFLDARDGPFREPL